MPRSLRALVPAALAVLLLVSACSGKLTKQKGLTDTALFARGQQEMQQKDYEDAAEAFQLLVERYPNSPLAPQAQFGLASSRMNLKENIEAEVAFDDFLRLYPADPKVPDALFLKGELLHRQILAPGRSQEKTREAIETFRRFLEKEPASPRAERAKARVREMRGRLVLHEEEVVSHLISRRRYESAELRARRTLEEYPEAAPTENLLTMLAEALEKQGKTEEASKVRKERDVKFPRNGSGKR